MRTLVIGGAGFIGRHLTRLLCESGREVVVLGRRAQADRDLHPGARYVSGDYSEKKLLRNLISPGSEVVDLAYSTVPKTSFDDPVFDLTSNLPPSVGLFQVAAAVGVRRVVFVSSGGTVYGPARELPVAEDHPTRPISPYGITKLALERYAGMFHHVAGLPVVVVRPGNAYGEDQRGGTGQGFIATAVRSILEGREIAVFGKDGTVRDYIHVQDVAAGIFSVLEKGRDGETYNLGTGRGASNAEVLGMLEPLAANAGLEVRTSQWASRLFDVEANVLDSSKLEGLTGWRARVHLAEGISRVWHARLEGPARHMP